MNAELDRDRWSLSKWFATIAFALGIQAILVFLFSERETALTSPTKAKPTTYYLGTGIDQSSNPSHILARDASLLTRPHPHSFTGSLWDQPLNPEREYIPWTEDPHYYDRVEFRAGDALKEHIRSNPIAPSVVSKSHPELSEAEKPQPLPQTITTLAFSEDIRPRRPKSFEPLPAWPHTNLVKPTVVAIALDRFGWSQSALIVSNSLPNADSHALSWLRQTRFQPVPPKRVGDNTDLAWGQITFRWATLPSEDSTKTKQ